MSLYDKASLVMIPSGYKASSATLYSVVPNTSVGDFDVTVDADATRVNKDGLIESVAANQARLDYPLTNGVVGDCPHLLLEPSRTNFLTYSTLDFNGGATPTGWTVGFGTGTFSHTETTYKGQGAVKHTQSTTGRSYLSETISLSASTTYTLRVEFDRNNSSGIDDTDYIVATANMDNSFAKQWSDVDDDGILEVQFTTGTDATGELRLGFGVSGNEDGGKTIVFSMPQIEAGSYSTSYIPTSGFAVTRTADTCNGAGDSSTFNDSEGVLFAEIAALADDGTSRRITITDDSGANYNNIVSLELDESTNTLKGFVINNSGNITSVSTTNLNQDENNKIALKYNSASTNLYVNGSEVDSATSTNLPTGLVKLDFDSGRSDEIQGFYGKCKQLIVFNEALSDSELQQLTS